MNKNLATATFAIMMLLVSAVCGRAQTETTRLEAGAQFSLLNVERVSGRRTEAGVGGRFGVSVTENVVLEAEFNFFPREGNGASNLEGGRITQGLFGVKAGRRFARFGVFGKARPGFVSFGRAILGPRDARDIIASPQLNFQFGRLTHFAFDAGGVIEVYPSRRTVLRFDLGDAIIRYGRQERIDALGQPYATESFTRHNLQVSAGVGFRF